MSLFKMICVLLRAVLSNRARLAAENLALPRRFRYLLLLTCTYPMYILPHMWELLTTGSSTPAAHSTRSQP